MTARTAGKVTHQRRRRPPDRHDDRRRAGRHREDPAHGRTRLGLGRLCGGDAAPSARRGGEAACPAAPSACNGSRSTKRARTLALEMPLPSLMRPNGTLRVPVRLDGLGAGEEAQDRRRRRRRRHPQPHQLQAAGARRLLSRPAPAHGGDPRPLRPTDRRHAGHARRDPHRRRRLGGGARRHAADPAAARALSPASSRSAPDGTAEVAFDIPAFAGTVRVMAVAWSKDKVGHASGDVIVRDPVVLTATLPRFLLTGDRGSIRLDLDNVEGPAGDYAIEVQTEGPLAVGAAATQTHAARRQAALRRQPADQRHRASASATWRCASAGRTASRCSAATRSPPSRRRRC